MLEFYKGKKVFITGHTGFKGTWLSFMLAEAGAEVTGYALEPDEAQRPLWDRSGVASRIKSVTGDIRDFACLKKAFDEADPEIVIHMAAQPLVIKGYQDPAYTYETNVMGTVNILECVRQSGKVRSFVNVTTDKVYENPETGIGCREDDKLDGYDPYSNSKSCSDIITHSYARSFLTEAGTAVSCVRAGNVLGGGDFSENRIIPDCVRALHAGEPVMLRHPGAVRPFQFVAEPLYAYLMAARKQYEDPSYAGMYNVGPEESDCITVGELAKLFCEAWGEGASYQAGSEEGPHEAGLLRLNCEKIRSRLGWKPVTDIGKTAQLTAEWAKTYYAGGDIPALMRKQLEPYR